MPPESLGCDTRANAWSTEAGQSSQSYNDGMNMKKKRKQKSRAAQVQNLEELLTTGETPLYGQVCWSIANNGTEVTEVGDIITLERPDKDRDPVTRDFRLTGRSVENIGRCMGMRTCGEAQVLFAEPRVAEPPQGACPNGHPAAALDSMMYGIRPTEPCPKCGEIPEFFNMSMSPEFYSDGPVRGVDGQEYQTCPRCGDDSLHLEVSILADWGWRIVCLNCEWEMKLAERLDIDQYLDLMREVKARIESISQLTEMPGITNRTRVESVCLQLRMLLELVVFSSLVSNKDAWQRSRKELRSSRDISKKIRELRRLHPNFYPRPVDSVGSAPGEEPAERTERFLSEDGLIEVYGRLGGILHAENPLGRQTDYRYFMDEVPGWISQVQNLLGCHKVYLYHRPEEFYLVKMFGDVDGEVMCIPFRTTTDGETKCAWPDCVSSSGRQYCEYIQHFWRECPLPEIESDQTLGKEIADELDAAARE